MSAAERPSAARLTMLDAIDEVKFRVGCATPNGACSAFPRFASTLDEARSIAKQHVEEREHVLAIQWMRTTPIEVWAVDEKASPQ